MARKRGRHSRRWVAPVLFVAPYLVFLLAFGLGPTLYGIYTSFTQSAASGATEFAGFSQWTAVFTDFRLPSAVDDVGKYLLFWLPTLVVLSLTLSLLLHARPGKLSNTFKLIYYLPGAVTGSAAALLWLFMVSPQFSPVGALLRAFGITSVTDAVSGSRLVALLVVMGLVSNVGGWVVVVYGAMSSIPSELLESAAIDGCSSWQLSRHLKLPLVRRYVILILISAFAAGTQLFVEPTVLSTGAPGEISPTWSINQLSFYYATQESRFGEAAALSIALLAVGLVAALLLTFGTKFYRHDVHE